MKTCEEVKEVIVDFYYELKPKYEAVLRGLRWGWRLRYNYEWDSGFLLEIEVLKLKELLHNFEHHGHHDPECENYAPKMKSLRLAIKLGDLLINDDYMKYHNRS